MTDQGILKLLLYCTKCYKPTTESSPSYIGECMHIFCKACFTDHTKCTICSMKCSFIQLNSEFSEKLLKNPSETFMEPIEAAMFQLSSAMNLILYQKSEISKLRNFLKRAKDELERVKNVKVVEKKNKLFNFNNEKNDAKEAVDKIYNRNKAIKRNDSLKKPESIKKSDSIVEIENRSVATKRNYLGELTNKNKKQYFTNYNPSEMSLSMSRSSRAMLPKKENEFKYVYRRHQGF